uniref:Putative secreted protein n=1 Tax=Anopheles darlingi TaxID=43151 RepID=A0A2M4DPH5_ANODA
MISLPALITSLSVFTWLRSCPTSVCSERASAWAICSWNCASASSDFSPRITPFWRLLSASVSSCSA